PAQLQEMMPSLTPKVVKARLKHLASQLRQYRIHARSGNPQIYQPQDDSELERLSETQTSVAAEDDSNLFLHRYRQVLDQLLGQTIAGAIALNVSCLSRRTPPQDGPYVQGLHLRLCEGVSMTQIAPRIGLNSQVQVTRLLNLKRLRADVRHQLIPQLTAAVRQEAAELVSADRLRKMDATLETILSEQVDILIADAAAEAQSPKPRKVKSRFAERLCAEIHAFMPGQTP
ncbi:MAG: hypothetical protein SNJ81_15285, partial [Cyanobacteriota bacterium]